MAWNPSLSPSLIFLIPAPHPMAWNPDAVSIWPTTAIKIWETVGIPVRVIVWARIGSMVSVGVAPNMRYGNWHRETGNGVGKARNWLPREAAIVQKAVNL